MSERVTLDKVQLNRVRRMAARQGLFVHKNNSRCPWAEGYNGFLVYELNVAGAIFGVDRTKRDGERGTIYTATLDDVEAWLAERVAPPASPTKSTENRVRRAAARQGYQLRRARVRDIRARGYATYELIQSASPAGGNVYGPADLGAVEEWLSAKRKPPPGEGGG